MRRSLMLLFAMLLLASGCRRTQGPTQSTPSTSVQFRDVAGAMGLDFRYTPGGSPPLNILKVTTGAGAGFLDYDRDGWQDVLCTSLPQPALYRNEQGRGFTNVTTKAGLAVPEARWNGCAIGDYDNDGWVDLFLTACDRTALLHNNGNGTFTDVTDRTGVQLHRWATSAAFSDVNGDGLLDLYVGCYVRFGPGMPEWMTVRGVHLPLGPLAYEAQKGVLFLNTGSGRFRDATREAGLDTANGKALGVAFADADGDGDDDLYVANDEMAQDFFENDGTGHFRNVALENGTAFNEEGGRQGGMGIDFADYDGDGRLDLFVGTFEDELKSLYQNTGAGAYEQASATAGIAQSTRAWVTFGTKFVDVDNDGMLDLTMVNGHVRDLVQQVDPKISYPQPSQLFLNLGKGRFREISDQVGPDFRKRIVGRGLAVGDFDNDGRMDLLAADLQGAPLLLHNESTAVAHWLALRLEGKRSNRMGIGARVELLTQGRSQVREVRTDGSFLSAHDQRVHFGLGAATEADEIRIKWPSGQAQTLKKIKADQLLDVKEP